MIDKEAFSQDIAGMDLRPRTGIFQQVRNAFVAQSRRQKTVVHHEPTFILRCWQDVLRQLDMLSECTAGVADLTYQALDMYFPLFIFFAGRSVGSAPPVVVSPATSRFLAPSWLS